MSASRSQRFLVSFALVLGSIALTILAVLAADRAVGAMLGDPRLTAGLIFPPQVELAVKNYEYSYTIRTNNLGLRDEDFDLRHPPRVLVAAIGDSFTFGFGVELDQTWVQIVERNLRAKGLDVEILNLGQPGSSPYEYALLAEETLSLLKPDLVIVGMLQTNDLYQLDPDLFPEKTTRRRDPPLRTALRAWLPNLTDLAYREHAQMLSELERQSQGQWNALGASWKHDFERLYNNFDNSDEGARYMFMSLPSALQDAFRNGEIPPILASSCSNPVRLGLAAQLDPPLDAANMQPRITAAAGCLRRINTAARSVGASAFVITLPALAATDPFGVADLYRVFGNPQLAGFFDNRADDAICLAAQRADVPCHTVTADFRKAARQERLFYPIDSHMNARGNEVYAALIEPVIESEVRTVLDQRH